MIINCDMGESFGRWQMGQDQDIMPYLDAANIACGFHAGDPCVMRKTVALALQNNVKIGAHPGYPDLAGFGRRSMSLSAEELTDCLWYQMAALDGVTRCLGGEMSYIKPHGALYNDMMKQPQLLRIIMQAVRQFNPNLTLIVQAVPGWNKLLEQAQRIGLAVWFEAFSDRLYQDNGLLTPRSETGATLGLEAAINQSQRILNQSEVVSVSGKVLDLKVDTLCIHGDGEHAVTIASQLSATDRKV